MAPYDSWTGGKPGRGRRAGWRLLAALVSALVGAGIALPATASSAAVTVLPYLSAGYRYEVVPHGAGGGFEAPGFNDSSFATGSPGFGTGGWCPLDSTVATYWTPNTDLLTRRAVNVPAGATGASVRIAIDNDVQVYWNGTFIGSASHEGCAARDSEVFSVPASVLNVGSNLLAVRAIDRGGEDYFDASVVATGSGLSITASAESNGLPYASNSWTDHDVVVSFQCTSLAAIVSMTSPITFASDGSGQSASGSCTDSAGATASTTLGGIDVDETPPVIGYSAHPATYALDQTVSITCSASDALSGLASDTCQDIAGPAYTFPLGLDTFSATASDVAGNDASATTSFTVVDTAGGLCGLVQAWEAGAGIANSLCQKLAAAERDGARGDLKAKAGVIDAFDQEVEAQAGKSIASADAQTLIDLAAGL